MFKSFIESQFPVSKVSKESYKERKANYSQTLTGLGKWWGRKPLILVRAALLGLLMPASADPVRDREIFLKILTMDEEGLWIRKNKNITVKEIYQRLTPKEREQWIAPDSPPDKPRIKRGTSREEKENLQRLVFRRLSYDEKLTYCNRPEHVEGPSQKSWKEINAHLGTKAQRLPELVQQLGERQFGRVPRVGDAFCGGGSIPFEAARLGCEAYGSDLNPVAALLTWAALNIVGGGKDIVEEVRQAQLEVYQAVDRQITEWGIEHNELGWRADAYLYCNEVVCPECGWLVPLAPSWVIGEKTRCIAKLEPNKTNRRFEILIESNVNNQDMIAAKENGTVRNSSLVCTHCGKITPMTMLRGDRRGGEGSRYGLRPWESQDLIPHYNDVFQERLYCIRWVETYIDDEGEEQTYRQYMAPNECDLQQEKQVLELLSQHINEWQKNGYIPSRYIEPGDKTDELIRTRGWTHWHHLFNPRQLLTLGLICSKVDKFAPLSMAKAVTVLLILGRCLNFNSRLTRWVSNSANEKGADAFNNQALNTLYMYICRSFLALGTLINHKATITTTNCSLTTAIDARKFNWECEIYITDPPYADAINYHELSEFFLSWYEKHIPKIFPDWYNDSKRALAITGIDQTFSQNMVGCYRNFAKVMPDDGIQIVMFTHQDAGVWADLALILWAAGLRVTAAWCIATETDSSLKQGNYVQGTVLLILRKQTSEETAFFDEIYPQVEVEVKNQLNEMLALDDQEDPNFGDTDYQLAAYAAALRVLTRYRNIEDIDVTRELSRPRQQGEQSPVVEVINQAVRIACDHLVPQNLDTFTWKGLAPEERFYLKGLDMESRGEYRAGAYQELARGFGLREYKPLMAGTKANQTRVQTAGEFGARQMGDTGFGASLVRQVLFAVRESVRTGETVTGRNWFRNELQGTYWDQRQTIIKILNYLANLGANKNMPHWQDDANGARLLAGAVENDHI
jgi:adenine-specific DNA methylase